MNSVDSTDMVVGALFILIVGRSTLKAQQT